MSMSKAMSMVVRLGSIALLAYAACTADVEQAASTKASPTKAEKGYNMRITETWRAYNDNNVIYFVETDTMDEGLLTKFATSELIRPKAYSNHHFAVYTGGAPSEMPYPELTLNTFADAMKFTKESNPDGEVVIMVSDGVRNVSYDSVFIGS